MPGQLFFYLKCSNVPMFQRIFLGFGLNQTQGFTGEPIFVFVAICYNNICTNVAEFANFVC